MKALITALTLLSILIASPLADARSKKKSSPPPAVDTSDRISAVHLMSITVSIHSPPSSKEYKVTPATRITVNGQPAQISGLATGMNVVVTPAGDGVTAASIDAKTAKR